MRSARRGRCANSSLVRFSTSAFPPSTFGSAKTKTDFLSKGPQPTTMRANGRLAGRRNGASIIRPIRSPTPCGKAIVCSWHWTETEFSTLLSRPGGSTSEQQLTWLFGVRPRGRSFVSREFSADEPELDFAARYILDEIGVEFEDPEAGRLDGIVERFGTSFPSTAEFSLLARRTLPHVQPEDDPDAALLAWLSHEEALFRRLERRIVSARLEQGFSNKDGTDVDGFIRFSLSVQNRRKSRMGYSLEHHLEAVFQAFGIAYARGAVTENNQKPDFLFPSVQAYRSAPASGSDDLSTLGAKSTCKDRWRQVLAEAVKIPRKHLLTLEPGISEPQTAQMAASDLQLVIPQGIHDSYTAGQRAWLWNLEYFIGYLRQRSRN